VTSASNIQPSAAPATRERQQYLKFLLQPGLMALIEIACVTESIDIPLDRVVPMPHLPPAVKGVYNWRGEILWLVDLAMLLGIGVQNPPCYRRIQPTIIISSTDDRNTSSAQPTYGATRYSTAISDRRQVRTIGLLVNEIVDIEWCQIDLIRSVLPDRFHPESIAGVLGMWASTLDENFLVLDGRAILDRADLHADV
jgi:positive phototaxis protein PixI